MRRVRICLLGQSLAGGITRVCRRLVIDHQSLMRDAELNMHRILPSVTMMQMRGDNDDVTMRDAIEIALELACLGLDTRGDLGR